MTSLRKILLISITVILLIAALVYTLLFTSVGNSLLKPSIEARINESSPVKVSLEEFTLRTDRVKILITIDKANSFLAQGSYSLFAKSFDIDYTLSLKKLSNLNEVLKRQLSGELSTNGKLSGDIDLFKIKGQSNVALSDTDYAIVIKDMQLDKAAIKLSNAHIKDLLSMAGEKPYASGKIDMHVQLNELNPPHMKGKVLLNVKEAKLDAKILKKEFGVDIARSSLKSNLSANLDGEDISYIFDLNSELATFLSTGKLNASNASINADYKINIKELALLHSLTKSPLRGPFSTKGKVSGNDKELLVKGRSDLAQSKTTYNIVLNNYKTKQIDININDAELSKLLYFAGQPSYAKGKVDLDAKVSSVSVLEAKAKVSVSQATTYNDVIKKHFDITLPYTTFELVSDATIKDDRLLAKTTLTSNLATIKIKKTDFNIKTASLTSDYDLFLPSLERLEPVIERKLKGTIQAYGKVVKDKKFTLTAHSDIFKGKLDAKIVDETINADFKNLEAKEVLRMLTYPEVINAPVDGNFAYNMSSRQGKLEAHFDKATLVRSKMTDLVSSLTHADLTKERFSKGSLISLIDKEIITSELTMQSKTAHLKSKRFIINSKKKHIDARFALKVKEYPGDVIVTGDINSPKVQLDAKSMLTPEIKEKVGKEINRFLKKLF